MAADSSGDVIQQAALSDPVSSNSPTAKASGSRFTSKAACSNLDRRVVARERRSDAIITARGKGFFRPALDVAYDGRPHNPAISVALNVPILMFMIQGRLRPLAFRVRQVDRRHPAGLAGIAADAFARDDTGLFSIALGNACWLFCFAGVYDRNLQVSGTAVAAPDFGVRHVYGVGDLDRAVRLRSVAMAAFPPSTSASSLASAAGALLCASVLLGMQRRPAAKALRRILQLPVWGFALVSLLSA